MWDDMTRDERIAAVKQGLAEHLSFTQIAMRIGGCSRNATIGLAHRAKLSNPNPIPQRAKKASGVPRTKRAYRPAAKKKVLAQDFSAWRSGHGVATTVPDAVEESELGEIDLVEEIAETSDAKVLFKDSSRDQCKFPMWPHHMQSTTRTPGEELFVCGRRTRDDRVCCDLHHKRAHHSTPGVAS